MNLLSQKRIAADVMGIGTSRVVINPEMVDDVSKAITRDDIRRCISIGAISLNPVKGNSRARFKKRAEQKKKGRMRGPGHNTGKIGARVKKKKTWIGKIRAIRDELRKMKDEKSISESEYRKLYRQGKGNLFHSRRHVREHIERIRGKSGE